MTLPRRVKPPVRPVKPIIVCMFSMIIENTLGKNISRKLATPLTKLKKIDKPEHILEFNTAQIVGQPHEVHNRLNTHDPHLQHLLSHLLEE